jgi:hypothetical protein
MMGFSFYHKAEKMGRGRAIFPAPKYKEKFDLQAAHFCI